MSPPTHTFKKWLPAIIVMALILLMSTTPGDDAGSIFKWFTGPLRSALRASSTLAFLTRPDWLKVGHVIAYGVLGGVLYNALRRTQSRPLLWSLLIVFAFACLDELVQSFVPGRSAALTDVLLDTGAALFIMFVIKIINPAPNIDAEQKTHDGGRKTEAG